MQKKDFKNIAGKEDTGFQHFFNQTLLVMIAKGKPYFMCCRSFVIFI